VPALAGGSEQANVQSKPSPIDECRTFWRSLGDDFATQAQQGKLSLPPFEYPEAFPRCSDEEAIVLLGDPKSTASRFTPNMLLAGLEKQPPLLLTADNLREELMSSMMKHPCALLAVSGQGKTRLQCEMLSCNYGLLLVSRPPGSVTLNPGSKDVLLAVEKMVVAVGKINNEGAEKRHRLIEDIVSAMLLVRMFVLDKLLEVTSLTPYQWLLLQLYPDELLGKDVLQLMLLQLFVNCDLAECRDSLRDVGKSVHSRTGRVLPVFLDEAQLLGGMLQNHFLSESGASEGGPKLERDLLSAVVKAFVVCKENALGTLTYPTLAGTGFSLTQHVKTVGSAMQKGETGEREFTNLWWARHSKDALRFLGKIADLKQLDADVVAHVGGWLVGRARWGAAFARRWLDIARTEPHPSSAGPFAFFRDAPSGASLLLHYAIGQYVIDCTAPDKNNGPATTPPVGSTGNQSPRGVVARLRQKERRSGLEVNRVSLLGLLSEAALLYSCSCNRRDMAVPTGSVSNEIELDKIALVEQGLCLITQHDAAKRNTSGKPLTKRIALAEPLIVEAVTALQPWGELVVQTMTSARNATNASGEGVAFESCSLPIVDAVFRTEIGQQSFASDVPEELHGSWARGRSACGVVVCSCATDEALKLWATQLRTARFDGQVAPMCAPWAMVGPDLMMMLMRWGANDRQLLQRVWAEVQLKLAKDVNIANAMRTVDPELLLHKNRDTEPNPIGAFPAVYESMFKKNPRDEPVFRVLIHCSDDKQIGSRRATFLAEAKKKQKMDAMLYLGPSDVNAALQLSLGKEDAERYLDVILRSSGRDHGACSSLDP